MMAGGTVLAGALALERGWARNLGGGMHHAHYHDGGGWCAYDDITLMLREICRASEGQFRSAMIVDVDVHQGNGHERSKMHFNGVKLGKSGNSKASGAARSSEAVEFSKDDCMPQIFTVDVYNSEIYLLDYAAKAAIDVDVPLRTGTGDEEYLSALKTSLEESFERCSARPQLLVYNAGTDVLVNDPLGRLNVSQEGVIERDRMVFEAALKNKVPVVMVTSGGYSKQSAPCIAASVENLVKTFGLGT